MKKKALKTTILVAALLYILIVGFVNYPEKYVKINKNYLVETEFNYAVLPEIEEEDQETVTPPFVGKTINGFKEAVGFKESRGNYFVVNSYGYLGKYQFGVSTLRAIGVYNIQFFLNHPEIQERAFIAFLERNKWVLRKEIKEFSGKTVQGITITESGILAAAHLAGPGNVKRYLRSRGSRNFRDANGTSVWSYMKKFSGYDLSYIKPDKQAKI